MVSRGSVLYQEPNAVICVRVYGTGEVFYGFAQPVKINEIRAIGVRHADADRAICEDGSRSRANCKILAPAHVNTVRAAFRQIIGNSEHFRHYVLMPRLHWYRIHVD